MRRSWALLCLITLRCNDLPAVAPERFACVADTVAIDGAYECPASHYCADQACTPRLNCQTDDRLGCTPESTRCELSSDADRAAVSCQPGIFTVTSTPVRDLDGCPCPDGLACTALATLSTTVSDALAYPLFVLPTSLRPARLPIGPLGITGEIERARSCTRPCGSEVDCGAGFTCRAATVLEGRAGGGADLGRHTVGVCFPDLLTTTTTAAEQPDPGLCRTQGDCTLAAGRFEGHCKAGVEVIPDHPTDPAGAGWGDHRAMLTRCVVDGQGVTEGKGCTSSAECRSGACVRNQCATLCDPADRGFCPGGCVDAEVERKTPSGDTIRDRIFVCART